ECFLIAYSGNNPVGIAGVTTEVDAALMGPFFVAENMRYHAVGARLVSAVRLAAHTRGARTLYAAIPATSVDYFARFGFAETNPAELLRAFAHPAIVEQIKFGHSRACAAVRIDISRDSTVSR